MNITEFKYRYNSSKDEALVLYRLTVCRLAIKMINGFF